MTRVLITGANGHLGANTVRAVIDAGFDAVPFARKTSDLTGLDGLDLPLQYGDVMDKQSLIAAAQGGDVIINR